MEVVTNSSLRNQYLHYDKKRCDPGILGTESWGRREVSRSTPQSLFNLYWTEIPSTPTSSDADRVDTHEAAVALPSIRGAAAQ